MSLNTIYKNALSSRKLPKQFIPLAIVALTVYVCISLSISNSVKVGTSIAMKNVYGRFFNISNRNKSDELDSFPGGSREHGERHVYPDKNTPSYTDGVQDMRVNDNKKRAEYTNSHSHKTDLMDQQRTKVGDKLSTNYSFRPETERFQKSRYTQKNNTILPNHDLQKSVYNVNFFFNNLDEGDTDMHKRENGPSDVDVLGNNVGGTDGKRKETCIACFQHNFKCVIENDICKIHNHGQKIDLLIVIATAVKNTKARTALRNTWLSFTERNTAHVRYAFLLGETKDQKQRQNILNEDGSFHDIIKEDFVDSYSNLTYKTIMGFKWASTKCAHARYVMKTDDDIFVNIPNLIKIIRSPIGDALHQSVAGALFSKVKPIRNESSKWFASVQSYPQRTYPDYCSGTGYITSMKVATKIYQISPNVPFFHLEDAYVGLCLKRLGFRPRMLHGFHIHRPKLDPCLYKGRKLITAHQMTPSMLTSIWRGQCTRFNEKV